MASSKISVFGLGKLGAAMAACFASRNIDVVGVDISDKTVEYINCGAAPVSEPGLSDLISSNSQRLSATTDVQKAISETDISFIIVPTPSKDNGSFSLKYVTDVSNAIGKALAKKSQYHLIVLTSTVLPGSTQYGVLPVLERESGKRCGKDFGLCYNPEFIALGSVIRDFLNPDFLLIGESDKRAGNLLEEILKSVTLNDPPVQRMNHVNAEMAKIALNSFVTTKITFANMLAEISGRLPGADVDSITNAIGLDSRIGRRYLSGGLSYGGPCFPRDNRALGYIANQFDCKSLIPESTDEFNLYYLNRLVDIVRSKSSPKGKISVLGLSYKPSSDVVEESPGIYLVSRLVEKEYAVSVFDPIAMNSARDLLGRSVTYSNSLSDCLSQAETVVIINPDPVFASIRPSDIPNTGNKVTVVDCWRILRENLNCDKQIDYVGLGIGKLSKENESHLSQIWNN